MGARAVRAQRGSRVLAWARGVAARGAIAAFAVVVAPGCVFETIESRTCPDAGTRHTYQNFGADFMFRYCQGCHGSRAGLNRQGAPGEFIFDTVEQVRLHRARIYARSAAGNDSMPPGPLDPPRSERDKLAEWLACGAP